MLIVLAADKGAPGVTTSAVALAAVWPRPALLVEADVSGGDLLYRVCAASGQTLDPHRTLASLAEAAHQGESDTLLDAHTQHAVIGSRVLLGVVHPQQAPVLDQHQLWSTLVGVFAAHRDPVGTPVDVLVDVGRVSHTSPALVLVGAADHLLLVTRPDLAALAHLRDRADHLADYRAVHGARRGLIGTVLVTAPRARRAAVDEFTSFLTSVRPPLYLAGWLPDDPGGARALYAGRASRSALCAAARTLATALQHAPTTVALQPQPQKTASRRRRTTQNTT